MKQSVIITILLLISILTFSQKNNIVNHKLFAKINPETSEIEVTDSISITGDFTGEFLLNSDLLPFSNSKNIKLKKIQDNIKAGDIGMDRDNEEAGIKLTKYKISGKNKNFVISYKGKIASEIEQSKENYQRGFSQSAGIICNKGIYLAGSTYWIPVFDNTLITFSLTCELPENWKNVSQGKRIKELTKEHRHFDTWVCTKPQEEVFLIAAKFTEYSRETAAGIKIMAFLRTPDEGLANKYSEVTEQYMQMYESMLGNYPYSKFALVENFWETGYGMPSFTLLGEKIIRFPFILHSSYPHELLHNWWGNSVYVDFSGGNWCEGTTAFMADHLIKEQRGAGEEYRRSTLQKFTNLVNKTNDFPLSKFRSRYNGASEAIGYGKALMIWQMLRRKLGDELFLKGMRLFYKKNIYKAASYDDIRKAMEKVSGMDLKPFFKQWIYRTGAPELALKTVKTDMFGGKYRIFITLEQKQPDNAFNIDVPINIATSKGIKTFVFNMNKKVQNYQIILKNKPLKLAVDPQYDVFRILNPNEVPPALSKIWGSKENIIIVPSRANKTQQRIYDKFAKDWKNTDNDNFKIVYDNELKTLPKNVTAWVLGFENIFAPEINKELRVYKSGFLKDSVIFENKKLFKKGNDFIFTLFDKNNADKQHIFIAFDNEKAIPGLIRKLPHYGKYGYLAFTGDEPTNIAKGEWSVLHSPLVKTFTKDARKLSVITDRKALAYLKPVFSESKMMSTIKYLSSDELKGRGLGTPELDKASKYIAGAFKKAGLKPLIKDSYYQTFTHKFKDKGKLKVTNVIGIIPGTDPALKDYPVVVSAHYDHLGFGWPDVHKGDKGKIHHGADDNASGTAILIELARTMAKSVKPKRTIIFLSCSGEEAGLIGSRYFVQHRKEYVKGEIFADVNIDTDGSLFDKKLLVLNGNTAKEWKYIFMGTDYTTGVKSEVIDKELDASDQFAFIEKDIPAVQLFTGATPNYHRPTDTWEKIDGKGLVKVIAVAKEVLEYLADREDAMHYTGKIHNTDTEKNNNSKPKNKKNRRVSTGSVPDFSFTGKGVKIGSIVENSAGEKAGLKAGDIIIALNNKKVETLKQYSDYLKEHQPGDVITLTVLRNQKEKKIKLKLEER
ncbi:MAG: M20/M25/M40 family metallo-hydrolase [Chlorobi bacterium]|nr:M20/M25/M40 family metallo-hydrolase [Chlorobiota bacterium]